MRALPLIFCVLTGCGAEAAQPGSSANAVDSGLVTAELSTSALTSSDAGDGAKAPAELWPPGATDALLRERALQYPALAAAQEWLGTRYTWGGRGNRRHPGMDCLGLLYRAWGPVTHTAWTKYPVNPSPLVTSGLLGRPVPGLAGVLRARAAIPELHPGDVLYLLKADYEIEDLPLWQRTRSCRDGEGADANGLCTTSYWPWHTVLYVDQGVVVHAAPGDEVRTQRLDELDWDALFVTRPAS